MSRRLLVPLGHIAIRRWLALPLSVALGGLLVALVFAGLRPPAAAAAGLADPAANYLCTPSQLDLALATGGSATFNCGAPTVVTLTSRKNVPHNLTLDGTNTLILQGSPLTGVFTVPAGIHLSLLNLTLRDAAPGAINNSGVLNVTHAHFISDTAWALLNMAGGAATFSDTTVEAGATKGGALINGDYPITASAALTVINSTLHDNLGGSGAAIDNVNGPVTVIGSNFYSNRAFQGGAIWNQSQLAVSNSRFTSNVASQNVFDSLAQSLESQPIVAGPSGILIDSGGAIFNAAQGNVIVSSSSFTDNFSTQGGGAIMFGALPLGGPISSTGASLTIAGSTFVDNCTGGPGGAVAASQKTTVSGSSFTFNFADSSDSPCVAWSTSHPSAAGRRGPNLASSPSFTVPANLAGAGGALFSSDNLSVDSTSFVTNSATVTPTGGGGAIANFVGGRLLVSKGSFQGNNTWQSGGAIYQDFSSVADVSGSSFDGNSTLYGPGGAVLNLGVLTLTHSSLTHNSAATVCCGAGSGGAISAWGIFIASDSLGPNGPNPARGRAGLSRPTLLAPPGLYVDHTDFISNSAAWEGGAIDALNANILNSSFVSNTAQYGGAIDVLDLPFTITASSFIANAVISTWNGSAQEGGAIDTNGSPIAVVNSTFFGNAATGSAIGGAIQVEFGSAGITNSTFLSNSAATPGNGGAFSLNGSLIVHNVLIAFNLGGDCQISMTLSATDLEYPGTSCSLSGLHLDPKALPLANNGGPTLTSALRPNSPAIDAGDDAGCPATDQRGAHRPLRAHCDIGAYEANALVWLPLIRR